MGGQVQDFAVRLVFVLDSELGFVLPFTKLEPLLQAGHVDLFDGDPVGQTEVLV